MWNDFQWKGQPLYVTFTTSLPAFYNCLSLYQHEQTGETITYNFLDPPVSTRQHSVTKVSICYNDWIFLANWHASHNLRILTVTTARQTDIVTMIKITRYRASTSTRWHFAFCACCHSNETNALIANIRPIVHNWTAPPIIPPTYIRVHAVVSECSDGQTDTQVAATTIHFASAMPHVKCNNINNNMLR